MVSNTYIPGITTLMKMNNIKEDKRITNLQEETKNVFSDNEFFRSGLSNGYTTIQLNKDLLIYLKLIIIENSMKFQINYIWIFMLWKNNTAQKKSKYNYHLLTKEIDPLLKQVIINRKELGSAGMKYLNYFNVNNIIFRSILNEHNFLLKKEYHCQFWSKSPYKITIAQIKKAIEYIENNFDGRLYFDLLWSLLKEIKKCSFFRCH